MDEFYGSAAAYQAYHVARGRDESARSTASIETALLVASEWLDGSFGHMWPGQARFNRTTQPRDWPRSLVVDRDGHPVPHDTVPVEIERATYEAAYRHLTDATALAQDFTPHKYSEASIDGALRVKYRALDASTVQKQFPIIGIILSRLIGGPGNVSSLSSGIVRA